MEVMDTLSRNRNLKEQWSNGSGGNVQSDVSGRGHVVGGSGCAVDGQGHDNGGRDCNAGGRDHNVGCRDCNG
jgi:hypothetical protein